MKEDQLKLLENRINSAIDFIENLRTKEKKLLADQEELRNRILHLEKSVEEKDKRNDDLLKTQKYLKEKIEFILGKLEGLAEVPDEPAAVIEEVDAPTAHARTADQPVKGQPAVKERPRGPRVGVSGPETRGAPAAKETDGIIIEERIVDLKEENEKNRPKSVTQSSQGGTRTDSSRPGSGRDGYSGDLFSKDEESFVKQRQSGNADPEWYGDNPFVEI
jgi:FtsZ-binding cell division protein ZapB